MTLRMEQNPNLTPRERAELDWEKQAAQMQLEAHEAKVNAELEIKRLEVKWTQLFRIPQSIILLPVKLILAFAIPIAAISKHDLPEAYWELMRG